MNAGQRRPRAFRLALVVAVVVASVPFVRLGFGVDIDAWLVAHAADRMLHAGHYVRSRSAGFPLYEIGIVPFVALGGWIASNLVSVAALLVVAKQLFALEDMGELRHPRLTQALVVLLPIVFVNATSTMDYLPGLALVTSAYVAHRRDKPHLAALLAGLACGVRPTNVLYLVPIVVETARSKRSLALGAKVLALGLAVGLVVFSPAFTVMPFDLEPVAPSLRVVRQSAGLLGLVPTVGCVALALAAFLGKQSSTIRRVPSLWFHAWVVALFFVPFAWNSDEPAYLLPIVPSLVLVFESLVDERAMIAAGALLASRHFVDVEIGPTGARLSIVRGLTLHTLSHRRFQMDLRDAATSYRPLRPTYLLDHPDLAAVATHNPEWSQEGVEDPHQRAGLLRLSLLPRSADEWMPDCGGEFDCVRRCNAPITDVTAAITRGRVECIEDRSEAFRALPGLLPSRSTR